MQNFMPTRPYFIRAVYDWCVDSDLTPYVAVAVDERTRVPGQYVRDGQIVLNVAPSATQLLEISNNALTCQARFGGVSQLLYVPLDNILAIYARENGRGMAFEVGMGCGSGMELGEALASEVGATVPEESSRKSENPEGPDDGGASPGASGPRLRVVK